MGYKLDQYRNAKNKAEGTVSYRKYSYTVEHNGVTKDYDRSGRMIGSSGVDKTSSSYRMCGE